MTSLIPFSPAIALLADVTPSANTIWLASLSLVMMASGLATVGLWWQGRRKPSTTIEGQPITVKIAAALHDQFADKKDFETHVTEYKRELGEIWHTLRSENQRIGRDIARTRESVARVETATDLQNQNIAAIQNDIKTLLSRLPRAHQEL